MNNNSDNKVTWHLINDIHKLIEIEAQWQFVAQQSSNPNPFSSPKWVLNWYHIYWEDNWELSTLAGYINDELIAVFPCYIQHSQQWPYLKIMRPLGQGEPEESEVSSEYCDIIIAKDFENIVLLELAKELVKLKIDQILWHAALKNSYVHQLLKNVYAYEPITSHYRYIINCNEWVLSALSKNTRSRYKRSKSQLSKINAQFIWVNSSKHEKYVDLLTDYHQSRWQDKGNLGAFSHKNFIAFHKKYRSNASVRVSAITIDEHPIAINYYLEDTTTLYFYQCGWDSKNYATFSLGLALHLWSIENSHHKHYDFMMGDIKDSYKLKFGAQQEPMINIIINIKTYKIFISKLIRKIKSSF